MTLSVLQRAASVLALAFLLGACAHDAVAYRSAGELAAALAAAEIDCGRVQEQPPATLVESQSTCGSGAGQMEMYVFAGVEERDTWLRVAAQLRPVAVGPNWAITGAPRNTEAAAAALGGQVQGPQ